MKYQHIWIIFYLEKLWFLQSKKDGNEKVFIVIKTIVANYGHDEYVKIKVFHPVLLVCHT